MTANDYAVTAVALITVLAALAAWIGIRVHGKDMYEAGRQYEANRNNERRLRDAAKARAGRASPRPAPPWYAVVTPSRSVHGGIAGPATMPIPSQRARRFPAAITTTSELVRLTDEHIARMRADEEAYRRSLRQEISA
jgi:hypothetical protein